MTMLAVQSFLLLLAAFFAGAMIACFLRRIFFVRDNEQPAPQDSRRSTRISASSTADAQTIGGGQRTTTESAPIEASRFGRALTGSSAAVATADARAVQTSRDLAEEDNQAVIAAEDAGGDQSGIARASVESAAAAPAATNSAADTITAATEPASATLRSVAANDDLQTGAGTTALTPAAGAVPRDDLTLIRRIDAAMAERLRASGALTFQEIAQWQASDVARVNQTLGLVGRVEKENWIEQAQILAKGGLTDYARRQQQGVAEADVLQTTATQASADEGVAEAAAESVKPSAVAETTMVGTAEQQQPMFRRAAASEVGALRSVRSEALVGPEQDGDTENVFALPNAGVASGRDYDDLKRIRGIGVLIEKKLNAMGVRSYAQVANWTASDVARISEVLDFKGRIERESWIEQARILDSGGQTDFSRRG